ncbi:hypothetical protein KSD_51980 [Ktedonobacter sp. SOSP1-85]|uniref:pentapeptide repeat-containing protein n=1 Tax=Ktedonobacter sp. SOSP1-85 TaxID=2778367 RepID=UPI001A24E44F|nr:pentapeptide repeat-containing protein [Ktedonobacter sp. SOSP1-85]GHO77427.1 hypothetical protein KSD_51980 [Ktedonobacter sp. SOSP1-85]
MEIVLAVVSLIIAIVALVLAYRAQQNLRQASEQVQAQQEIWEKAQNTRQQDWRAEQEKHLTEVEHRIQAQIQQLQNAWNTLEKFERQQRDELRHAFEASTKQARAEYELARIPRIEDVPLPVKQDQSGKSTPRWQHVNLSGADLSGRDLSSRYLGHANLSQTILRTTKCFMADFSWANLKEADLQESDLSGANLTHTDLRGANLNGVNFLAADLYKTNLLGANLLNARNLTVEQLRTAIYDDSTLSDLINTTQEEQLRDSGTTLTNMRAISKKASMPHRTEIIPVVTPPITPMPAAKPAPEATPEQESLQDNAPGMDASEWLAYIDAATPVLPPEQPAEELHQETVSTQPAEAQAQPETASSPDNSFLSQSSRGYALLPDSLPETEGSDSYVPAGEPSALSPHLSGSSLLDLQAAALPETEPEPETKEVVAHGSRLTNDNQESTEH